MEIERKNDVFSGFQTLHDDFQQVISMAYAVDHPNRRPKEGSGLGIFLSHSYGDGSFTPDECAKVADELESLVPRIGALEEYHRVNDDDENGGWVGIATRLIVACRKAAEVGENVQFR